MILKHPITVLAGIFAAFVISQGVQPVAHAQYYGTVQPGGSSYSPGYSSGGYSPRTSRFGTRHRPHVYLGGQLTGMVMLAQVTDDVGYLGHGGGIGGFIGVRTGPFFSIEGNANFTFHDERFGNVIAVNNILMSTLTVDGKIHIPVMGPVEPFFQAGGGFAIVGALYGSGPYANYSSIIAEGFAYNLGGGLDIYVGPHFSVGGRVLYRGTILRKPDYTFATSSNFINGLGIDLNATFHF